MVPLSIDHLLFKAEVVFGVFGLFSYGSFKILLIDSIVLVDMNGREPLYLIVYSLVNCFLEGGEIAGSYFLLTLNFTARHELTIAVLET